MSKKNICIFIILIFILFIVLCFFNVFNSKSSDVYNFDKIKTFIECLGGRIVLDKTKRSVGQIFLDNRYITDADFDNICNEFGHDVLNVWHLRLNNTRITDHTLNNISCYIPCLFNLEIDWTDISNEGIVYLTKCNNLHVLSLKGTSISDASIDNLAKMTHLTTLDISGTNISDEGFLKLKLLLPFPKTRIIYRKINFNISNKTDNTVCVPENGQNAKTKQK
jgi:Leucine-rich repeat (LRR) protein